MVPVGPIHSILGHFAMPGHIVAWAHRLFCIAWVHLQVPVSPVGSFLFVPEHGSYCRIATRMFIFNPERLTVKSVSLNIYQGNAHLRLDRKAHLPWIGLFQGICTSIYNKFLVIVHV